MNSVTLMKNPSDQAIQNIEIHCVIRGIFHKVFLSQDTASKSLLKFQIFKKNHPNLGFLT